MPAIGNRGSQGVNPNKIKQAAAKPAPKAAKLPAVQAKPKVVTFKPSQVSTPSKRLTHTAKQIARQEAEIAHPPTLPGVLAKSRGRAIQRGEQDRTKPHGASGLAAIPALLPAAVAQGYSNILGTTGVSGEVGHLLGATAKNAVEIGELPLIGGIKAYETGYKRSFKPVKELGEGVVSGIKHGAAGELLQGHLGGAAKAAHENPLFAATELAGLAGAAGRTAGAVVRGAGSQAAEAGTRGALARAGSTVRPPVALTDEAGLAKQGLVKQREYSKDLGRKAVQVAADTRREPVTDAQGKVVTVKERGRQVPVLKPTPREQEKLQAGRASFESSRTQGVENLEREAARKTANKIEGSFGKRLTASPSMRLGHELSHLVATGTIRGADTFKADLEKRIETIKDAIAHPEHYRTEGTQRSPGELRVAKQNLAMLEKAVKNKRVLAAAPEIVKNGLAFSEKLKEADVRQHNLDIHEQGELERAALSEYAFAHMEARHGTPIERRRSGALAPNEMPLHEVGAHETRPYEPKAIKQFEAEAKQQIEKVRGKPDAKVTIYRADRRGTIEPGNWVTLSKDYAEHLIKNAPHARVGAKVVSKEVPAKDVRMGKGKGLAEQGYFPGGRGAPEPSTEPQILDKNGRPLTNETIREHALANGRHPDTLAYVPHVIGAGRKSSFHQPFRPGSRPVFTGKPRTGALFRRGATTIGTDLVREELTRKGTVAAKAQAIDKLVNEAGLRRPDGQHFNAPEALETATRLNADGSTQYYPVRAFAAKLEPETRQRLMESQNPAEMETAHMAMFNDRIVKSGDQSKARNVVLMPKHQIDTLMRQLRPPGETERLVQMLNNPFRMAVLPQPRWLAGNFIEPFLVRLPLSGAGINLPGSAVDWAAAEKSLKAMDASGDPAMQRAAQEIRAVQMGGMFIGRRGASIKRTYQDFPSGDFGRLMYGMHLARNLPAVKQMGDLILTIPHSFFTVNRAMESSFQRIAHGKQVREDVQAFTGSWLKTLKIGQQALDEVNKGLVNTATQHRFMQRQHELLGQYDAFNPTMRRLVQTAFPFLPWTLNSLRFVYWTLPAHHTVAFTALVKTAQHIQAEWEAEHKDVPPGTLSDALVRKDKGLVDVGRYTPFGVSVPLAHGETEGLTNTLLPQVQGATNALAGKDPFGRDLQVPKTAKNPKGKPSGAEKAEIAANQLLESLVPLVAMGRRMQEGGGTAYANSTIFSPKTKPGTSHGMSAFDRTLNPFRPTYVKPPKVGKAKPKKGSLKSGLGGSLGGSISGTLK